MVDQLSLSYAQVREIFDAIEKLPRRRSFECTCGSMVEHLSLEIYATCTHCGRKAKTRSFGAYTEPQDIIGVVLEWIGEGAEAEEILRRRQEFYLDSEWYPE